MIREDKNCYTCDNKKCNITHSCIRQDVTKHHEVFEAGYASKEKDTDLHIDKPVYAIHLANMYEGVN